MFFVFICCWITNMVYVPWFSNIKIPKCVVYGKKKKILDPTGRDLVETCVRDVCFICIYRTALFLQDKLCLGLMDQLHTKTSTSSLQMGPTQVPPTLINHHKLQKVLCPQPTGLLLRVKSKASSVIRVTAL